MIDSLSYIGFTSPKADEWRTFGPDLLGMELATDGTDGAVRLRMDDAPFRLVFHPGEHNDLAYLGWAVGGPVHLQSAIATLTAAGVDVHHSDDALLAEREVVELVWFVDPVGIRHELSWGRSMRPASFRPGRPMSGFVTGDGGLGHVVLFAPSFDLSERFYTDVMGFKLSDQVNMNGIIIRFLHCNPRHHSLAMVMIPGMVGFHHIMVEVASMDDVGNAFDLMKKANVPVAMGIGRHSNDLMTSFYVHTPSGFELEYGYGGLLVDDATWKAQSFNEISIWGHHRGDAQIPPDIMRPFEGAQS